MQSFRQWTEQGQFWGKVKLDEASGQMQAWLPLSQHCVDVAQVFFELVKSPYARRHLDRLAGAPLCDVQLARLAVVVFFHDLGKLSLGFQSKVFADAVATALKGHTADVLASLFSTSPAATRVLEAFPVAQAHEWFTDPQGLSACLHAVWSHHGQPVCIDAVDSLLAQCHDELWQPVGALDPAAGLAELVDVCRQQFPQAFETAPALNAGVELQHHLAGLAMLADWLGSNAEVFPLTGTQHSPAQRIALAVTRAHALLRGTALDGMDHLAAPFQSAAAVSFETLFAGTARPLQRALGDLSVTEPGALTLVAESETGSGKTEAALLWWAKLRAAGLVEGLYFALPTRVAARQLYERVVKFIASAYPQGGQPVVLLAVPGYVQSSANSALALPCATSQHHDDARIAAVGAHWASEQAKRFLAAPIVVGTIDQALLSTLQSNHAHLRAALLQRHLLVVDEVHSSDTYMRRLLKDLLERRRRTGSHSLMLSATLGSEARQDLLALPGAVPYEPAKTCPYPLISGEAGFLRPVSCAGVVQKHVRVTPLGLLDDIGQAAQRVARAVSDGARVLVVLNTVKRARAMQKALETLLGADFEGLFKANGVVCPHHGRYTAADRQLLDAEVGRFLGEGSPSRARVLVGTQTLEQSLDIDADVLFTDLCPMDVLLQRIGRLWRHARADRPAAWSNNGLAQCFLLVPGFALEQALDEPHRLRTLRGAGLGTVYPDLRILDLTWQRFAREEGAIALPADNRPLVEAAVHSSRLEAYRGPAWRAVEQAVWGARAAQLERARDGSAKRVFQTSFGERDCQFNAALDVVTRLGDSTALLKLDRPVVTPFGQTIDSVQVPGQDLRGLGDAVRHFETPAVVSDADGLGFTISWAGVDWRYDRFGLRGGAQTCRPM